MKLEMHKLLCTKPLQPRSLQQASKANTRHQVRGRILQGNGNDYDAHQVGQKRRTNNGTFLQWIELSD
jgi:hypothetical protein